MGKKAKKGGSSCRRRVPEPILPSQLPVKMATAVCPHCEERFDTADVVGGWLARRCPLCGGSLHRSCCDEAALRCLRILQEAKEDLAGKQREVAEARKRIDSHRRWWQAPYRWYWGRKRAKAEGARELAAGALQKARVRYDDARHARFHVSEWYLCTHTPLVKSLDGKTSYRLIPSYDREGRFFLNGVGSAFAGGLAAEFGAFEALQEQVEDPASPLHGARLLPNLYLPRQLSGAALERLWDQVDLVVATESCAFVVEIKKRRASVRAEAPFDTVLVGDGKAGKRLFEDAGWMLDQNAAHAVAFDAAVAEYPYESIYEVLLFVRPDSFESDAEGFSGNIFVGCVPEFTQGLVDAMGVVAQAEKPKMAREELDRLADDLLARYGDLNQMRGDIHVKRIQDIKGEQRKRFA